MIPLRLEVVASAVGGRIHHADPDLVIEAVTTDSRDVSADSLFVALPGETHDGHDHAQAAIEAGARAVVAQRQIGQLPTVIVDDSWQALAHLAGHVRDDVAPQVIGITGSVGKTTTKDLTGAAVGSQRRTVAARGSFNNEVGVPLTLLRLTPGDEVLVAEMGARGRGHIAELVRYVKPDIGIVTAVAEVHLELFGTIDDIAIAKGELVEDLPTSGAAILNHDDHRVRAMADRTQAAVLSVSADGDTEADLVATNLTLSEQALPTFDVATPWGSGRVRLPVAGRHNVGNALLALAAAGHIGIDLQEAIAAMQQARISSWRGEVADVGGVRILNDAYNANPTSTRAAIDTLLSLEVTGRRVAVLGVMAEIGPTAQAEHEGVGRYAAEQGVDQLVVVGDEASGIATGARAAGMPAAQIFEVADADAASAALDGLATGDALLVKASRVAALEQVAKTVHERLER